MPPFLDESLVSKNAASPPTTDDVHCQRVASLAAEIGRRLGLDVNSIEILREAASHHHSVRLQLTPKGLTTFALVPNASSVRNCENSQPVLKCVELLRVFNRLDAPRLGSHTAVLSEILRLANAFDESYEWRIFESGSGSESIKELDSLMQAGLWSQQVHQAFHSIFAGIRDRARVKAENLPLSIVSKIQKLAFTSANDLTLLGLEQMAFADPVISADLLRAANSAKYAVTDRISSVRQAIGYIGTVAARDVMLASAARGIFASSTLHRLWKHSVWCANTMKAVATHAGLDANRAFLLGLLHDIGRMSLQGLDAVTRSGHTQLCKAEAPGIWIEMATAGCDHAELGAEILTSWNFPESITESIRNHHSPELSMQKLTALLYLVECAGTDNEDLSSPSRFTEALSTVGLSQSRFEQALAGKAVAVAC